MCVCVCVTGLDIMIIHNTGWMGRSTLGIRQLLFAFTLLASLERCMHITYVDVGLYGTIKCTTYASMRCRGQMKNAKMA